MPAKAVGSSSVSQRSASGSASSAPSASLTIGPWWVMRTSSTSGASRPLTGDLLADDLERPPLVFEQVAVALDPLDEEVLDVGHHVGEGPADVVVLAHVDAGHARQRGAADEAVADGVRPTWYQMPGMLGGRCGSPAISGEPVALQLAGDRPVVGAARLGGQPDRAAHGVDLLDQRQARRPTRLPG